MAKNLMRVLVVLVVSLIVGIATTVGVIMLPPLLMKTPGWLAYVLFPGRSESIVMMLSAMVGVLVGYSVFPLHRLLLRVGLRMAHRAVPGVLPWPAVEAFAGHVEPPAAAQASVRRTKEAAEAEAEAEA